MMLAHTVMGCLWVYFLGHNGKTIIRVTEHVHCSKFVKTMESKLIFTNGLAIQEIAVKS